MNLKIKSQISIPQDPIVIDKDVELPIVINQFRDDIIFCKFAVDNSREWVNKQFPSTKNPMMQDGLLIKRTDLSAANQKIWDDMLALIRDTMECQNAALSGGVVAKVEASFIKETVEKVGL